MNKEETTYETYRLDHLGIVAGICEQTQLVETIDGLLPTPSSRHVSCGQATLAMVLEGYKAYECFSPIASSSKIVLVSRL